MLLLEKKSPAYIEVGEGAFQEQQNQTTHPSLVHTSAELAVYNGEGIENCLGSCPKPVYYLWDLLELDYNITVRRLDLKVF